MVSLVIVWWPKSSLIVVMWQPAFTSCVAQVWRSRLGVTFTPVRLLAPFNRLRTPIRNASLLGDDVTLVVTGGQFVYRLKWAEVVRCRA